jgi:hypothetical protein
VLRDPDLARSETQGADDGSFITHGASVYCSPQFAPDDDITAGHNLCTGIQIAYQCYMTRVLQWLSRPQRPPDD